MQNMNAPAEIAEKIRATFARANIATVDIAIRRFPGETIAIVEVNPADFQSALAVASESDDLIPEGFITVRKATARTDKTNHARAKSILDGRVNELIELLNARSRTSEQQPSLRYIRDASHTVNIATSKRHHLIFGRRGVGKTALMLEAKRLLEEKGSLTFWTNIQSIRSLSSSEAFLTTAHRMCDIPESVHLGRSPSPRTVIDAKEIKDRISEILRASKIDQRQVNLLLPKIQQLFKILGQETQADLYLFIDDFHYLATSEQPRFLDMIHSISRDNAIWIKAAGIRHQSRWFTDNPPVGLQTGHDAAIINLDITLEQPAKAKEFLSDILNSYADEAKLTSIFGVIARSALDRLVLASGGVPRDFLVLSGTAIQVARERPNAKEARVQDVNAAAGRNAQPKMQELEDDTASSIGKAASRIGVLNELRRFLIEERQITYFRVDFRDKESHPKEYDLLQSLMDLRLIHLINAGVSDEREAGRRSEVYMLDLSQYSATRFKRNLRVLDFKQDHLILKGTGESKPRPGDTPKRLLSILRRGPSFDLARLGHLI
jgi:hypothetical protein